ncbi:ribosome maturation factor RimM [Thioalkalivibrio sp. HK1]|uniref:ribosome maturation factor RimM n=1 Tax=Thioalkalivibrio sp. HK1 TaxID=1469245 RepID=UPI0004710BD9|nr:ribosome maturation factor RimM [Thioalkalivibrio sp. HK1]
MHEGDGEKKSSNPSSSQVIVGRVGGAFGVRGWTRIHSATDPSGNILDYRPWQIERDGRWAEIDVADFEMQGAQVLVRFDGCLDREAACAFRGCALATDRSRLPEPEAGEFYWTDLIGLSVFDHEGVRLGEVERILETGANDVMVVVGERRRLIPFLFGDVVRSVEIDRARIVVDWHFDD